MPAENKKNAERNENNPSRPYTREEIAQYYNLFDIFRKTRRKILGPEAQDILLGETPYNDKEITQIDESLGFDSAAKSWVEEEAVRIKNRSNDRGLKEKTCKNRAFKKWLENKYTTSEAKGAAFQKLKDKLRITHDDIELKKGQKLITPFMQSIKDQLEQEFAKRYKADKVEIEFYHCGGTCVDTYFFADFMFSVNIPGQEPRVIFLDVTKNPDKIRKIDTNEDTIIVPLDQESEFFENDEESLVIKCMNNKDIRQAPILRDMRPLQAKARSLRNRICRDVVMQLKSADLARKPKDTKLFAA